MNYEIITLLKEKNSIISGEEIGDTFSISRAAVWQNIKRFQAEGYNIECFRGSGYLLKSCDNAFNLFEIQRNITTSIIGTQCFFFDSLTSTNDKAKEIANYMEKEGTVVIAEKQTRGKGRQGKDWISEENKNISLSIILKPDISPMEATQITLISGIAVVNAIKKITGLESGIKWPNDIIINRKKVCGILTEMNAEIEEIKYVILGIGINVNNVKIEDEIKDKATSIMLELGKEVSRTKLTIAIFEEFEAMYKQYIQKKEFNSFINEYKRLCINMNQRIKAIYKRQEIIGTVIDIGQNGELKIKTDDNNVINIISGEVSIRLDNDKYI